VPLSGGRVGRRRRSRRRPENRRYNHPTDNPVDFASIRGRYPSTRSAQSIRLSGSYLYARRQLMRHVGKESDD
jgi:hypothetical protein